MFRFLYGRWIPWPPCHKMEVIYGSDSSMVDEYVNRAEGGQFIHRVQIPLWSMNTAIKGASNIADQCVQIPLWSMNTTLDEIINWLHDHVQIPLWSMNTMPPIKPKKPRPGSDSSMVDEYLFCAGFILFSLLRSDSSMVDEYHQERVRLFPNETVQIPLWSMNTVRKTDRASLKTKFRFLYGRWIHLIIELPLNNSNVQIPLWSMNTSINHPSILFTTGFRFLYGRWIPCYHHLSLQSIAVQIPLWSMNTLKSRRQDWQ